MTNLPAPPSAASRLLCRASLLSPRPPYAGTLAWQAYFTTFWRLVSPLIDPKTRSKVVFMSGDLGEGGANDRLMRDLVGDDWKDLTGAGKPVTSTGYSLKVNGRGGGLSP